MTALKPCGTRAAYIRHLSHNEVPCYPCTAANAARTRELRTADARRTCAACRRPYPAATGAHGWCNACWMRWDRAGRPDSGPPPARRKKAKEPRPPKLKPLTKRQAMRDDYAWLRQCGVDRQEAAERVGINPETGRQWDREVQSGAAT